MEDEFSLLCSNRIYLKKGFSLENFLENISLWVSNDFENLNKIIREKNEIIYLEDEIEEKLQLKVSKDEYFAFARFENHKNDRENRTYRVDYVCDVKQHLLQIELYCDKPSSTNPPKIIRDLIKGDNIDK